MEIMVHAGRVSDDPEDMQNFLHYLGSPPSDPGYDPAAFGRIFTRQRNGRSPFRDQLIRSRATRNQPLSPPLFRGMLKIRNSSDSHSSWTLDALLSLNATRFVRHQQFPRRPSRSLLQERPAFEHVMYEAETLANVNGELEFALIDADNWLPDDRLWNLFASPRFWQRHLEAYLRGTVEEIRVDLLRAAENANVRIERATEFPFSLQSVETYWEFYSDDPIGTVIALHSMLNSFAAATVATRDFAIEAAMDEQENSRRLSLKTRVGETLKIYAKTNKRVRFEVTHILSGQRPFRLPSGGRSFASIEGMVPLLGMLATIAATRVNEVLRHFRLRFSAPDENHTVLKLISDVQSAVQDPEKAFNLLQILTSNGSLVVGQGMPMGAIFRAELARLVRQGVLHRSNRRYSVTASYSQAIINLQQTGVGFLLGPRIRRRSLRSSSH